MHALEPDPEQKNRWKRMTTGAVFAGGIAVSFFFVAQHVEPARRLMPEILQIAVVDDVTPPPPPKDIPPPPPPPPPPKTKRAEPEQQQKSVEQPPPDQQPTETAEAEAGLNADSFGSGSGGVSFRTGKTQMGDPNRPAAAKQVALAPKVFGKPQKLVPAVALNPEMPTYPKRARSMNIQGFVVLEAELDERGEIKALRVRESLDHELDDAAIASVRRWRFQPAMLGEQAMPSTRLIRIRFQLD